MISKTPVAITDTDLIVIESVDREILAELPVDKIAPAKLAFPIPIRAHLVNEHRALFAPVAAKITLTVALDIEPADAA